MLRTRYAGGVPIEAKQLCRISTGSYTGDGTLSNPITGVGFTPRILRIFERETLTAQAQYVYNYTDTFVTTYEEYNRISRTNAIISLDVDGFTVSDQGSDAPPNKSGDTYDFYCLG